MWRSCWPLAASASTKSSRSATSKRGCVFSSSYSSLPPLPHRIFLLLTVVWAGSLWTVGYMVAPTLFSVLPSRETAGLIAGQLFRTEAILGVVVGVLQLALCNLMIRRGAGRYRGLRW